LITEGIERIIPCPLCKSEVDSNKLGILGLSFTELSILEEHTRNGTIKDILRSGEIALRLINPETIGAELQVNKAISKVMEVNEKFKVDLIDSAGKQNRQLVEEYLAKITSPLKEIADQFKNVETLRSENNREHLAMNAGLNDLLMKIVGPGIGKVGEIVTIQDLKRVAPIDSFDETRATKHGTDIVGQVNDNGIICGTVTISVKYTQTWSNEYLKQIMENMRDDGSKFGVLVSKAFPKEALSDKAWMLKTRDGMPVILVKPEYVSLAYFGLRQATIVMFEAKQFQETRERETEKFEKTIKALIYWINGEEFQDCIRYIDCAIQEANKTRDLMNTLKKHIDNKINDALECQGHITEKLIQATSLVRKLRELLNGNSSLGG
jgi:hypothetical protein